MVEEQGRSRLGRGLAALIGDVGEEIGAIERARGQRKVPVEFLRPNARNPRKAFAEADGVGMGKIGPPLRAALTAGTASPDIAKTLAALGKAEALGRLDDALSQAV